MTQQDLRKKIVSLKNKYSISDICKKAGISRPTFYNIIDGNNITTDTIEKIEKVFGKEMRK